MKKLLGSIGIVAVLGAGAFAISTVLPAGAQSAPPSTSSSSSAPNGKANGRGAAVKSALDGLVQNGTINQDQENAVIQALKGVAKSDGRHGPRARIAGGMLKVAADKIGVSPKDLVQARRNGQSIADVANSKSVNPADVVSAIVTAANQRIDQAVANGHLAQDKADQLKARIPQLADKFVNTKGGMHPNSTAPDSGSSSSDQSTSSSS
jgi:uncharacterized protein (DUF433 family)